MNNLQIYHKKSRAYCRGCFKQSNNNMLIVKHRNGFPLLYLCNNCTINLKNYLNNLDISIIPEKIDICKTTTNEILELMSNERNI